MDWILKFETPSLRAQGRKRAILMWPRWVIHATQDMMVLVYRVSSRGLLRGDSSGSTGLVSGAVQRFSPGDS